MAILLAILRAFLATVPPPKKPYSLWSYDRLVTRTIY